MGVHQRARLLSVPVLLATVLALVAGGCSGGPEPGEQLAAAFQRTADSSFTYTLGVEADAQAVGSVDPQAQGLLTLLSGLQLMGTVDGDASLVRVDLLGTPVLEVRRPAAEELYFRVGVPDLLRIFGDGSLELRDQLGPALEALGLPEPVRDAVQAALDGRWVGVQGRFESSDLGGLLGGGRDAGAETEAEDRARLEQLLGGDLAGFLERYVTADGVEEDEETGRRTFDASLRLRALLRAGAELDPDPAADPGQLDTELAGVPEQVAGTVVVEDGLVRAIRFDVGPTLQAAGGVLLRVTFDDVGGAPAVVAPDDASSVPAEELVRALELLASFATGAGQ